MPHVFETDLRVGEFAVHVQRKTVKTMRMRVVPPHGEVQIIAPIKVTDVEIISFVQKKRTWLERQRAAVKESPSSRAELATEAEIEEWRVVVKACVPALVAAWEPILGVKVKELSYRNMRSRWGSCQPSTGRICINVRLALYPPECLEYVVVHEMCHMLEANHGEGFKKLMTRVMPDWRVRAKKLR